MDFSNRFHARFRSWDLHQGAGILIFTNAFNKNADQMIPPRPTSLPMVDGWERARLDNYPAPVAIK
jgi:hypothetical protein